MMNVNFKGEVQWSPPVHFTVWCDVLNFKQWPNDVHDCEIYFGTWTDYENSLLQFDFNTSKVVSLLLSILCLSTCTYSKQPTFWRNVVVHTQCFKSKTFGSFFVCSWAIHSDQNMKYWWQHLTKKVRFTPITVTTHLFVNWHSSCKGSYHYMKRCFLLYFLVSWLVTRCLWFLGR